MIEKREFNDFLSLEKMSELLGHLGMLFFVFFSIYFFKERLLLIDASYYTFNILQDESFFIAHYRYINYFNQWLPILLMKMGVGLKGVLIGYSLSFILFYYVIFNVIAYVFKNPKAALFLVVTLVLSCRFKHFMAVTETTNTLALSFLFIGWVTRDHFVEHMLDRKEVIVAACMLLLLQIGHPVVFLPLLSFAAFYLAYHGKLLDKGGWLFFGMVALAMLIRYKVMPSSGYEQNKMQAFQQTPEILSTFFEQKTYQAMKDYLMEHFSHAYYLYILGLGALVYMRKFLSVLASVLTFCCFVAVVVIIYHKGESINMLESYYTYFGYFWGFTLMAVFMHLKASKWVKIVPIALILMISFRSLYLHGDFFTDRLEYLHSINMKSKDSPHKTSKLLFPKKWVNWDKTIVPWSVAFTTLIYSTLENPDDPRTTFFYSDPHLKKLNLEDEKLFVGPEFNLNQFNSDDLPKKYFNLPEGKYFRMYSTK